MNPAHKTIDVSVTGRDDPVAARKALKNRRTAANGVSRKCIRQDSSTGRVARQSRSDEAEKCLTEPRNARRARIELAEPAPSHARDRARASFRATNDFEWGNDIQPYEVSARPGRIAA